MSDEPDFREPITQDSPKIWNLIKKCHPLDVNSEYLYLLICHHFHKTSVAVESNSEIVGFISGYIPPEQPDTLFIWQVAVDEKFRKQGLAIKMAKEILSRDSCNNVSYIEATVTPSNIASRKYFETLSDVVGGKFNLSPLFTTAVFSETHEEENLIRIGPFKRSAVEVKA